jgi:integrase
MLGKQAKTISQPTLRRMLAYARRTRTPRRDQAIVLLSVKAGLRACEIAALEWPMVLDADETVRQMASI